MPVYIKTNTDEAMLEAMKLAEGNDNNKELSLETAIKKVEDQFDKQFNIKPKTESKVDFVLKQDSTFFQRALLDDIKDTMEESITELREAKASELCVLFSNLSTTSAYMAQLAFADLTPEGIKNV